MVEPLLQASVGLARFASEAKKAVQKCRGIQEIDSFHFDEENKHPKAGKKWSKGALCCVSCRPFFCHQGPEKTAPSRFLLAATAVVARSAAVAPESRRPDLHSQLRLINIPLGDVRRHCRQGSGGAVFI